MSEVDSDPLDAPQQGQVHETDQNCIPSAIESDEKPSHSPLQQLNHVNIIPSSQQSSATSDSSLKSSLAGVKRPLEDAELLGSVRTYLTDVTTVRTSARVIHKLREISSTPQVERKEPQEVSVSTPKTPSHTKPTHVKVQWINAERNYFYDALNEYGRDFEKISHFINMKMRRKASTDVDYKTKDQVRTLYFQLYNKAAKYLSFSSDISKLAQELYTVINYGEMKRKLVLITDKSFLKLRELVYQGSTCIRMKGRNIRIKTPPCRALRKLNQLEGAEEVLLPSRVDLIIRPGSMKAWSYVQNLAQNPRIRMTSLPLQKRLASVLATIHRKWHSNNARMYDRYVTSCVQRQDSQKVGEVLLSQLQTDGNQLKQEEPKFTLIPPKDTQIHRPMVQLNELLSSDYLCLNSYEDRIGATVRGEALCREKLVHIKDLQRNSAKRSRHDSSSDTSKTVKLIKTEHEMKMEVVTSSTTSSSSQLEMEAGIGVIEQDVLCEAKKPADEGFDLIQIKREEIRNDIDSLLMTLSPNIEVPPVQVKIEPQQILPITTTTTAAKPNTTRKKKEAPQIWKGPKQEQEKNYKPLIDEESIRQVRQGWTLENVGDVTIGDLYLMLGSDCRLTLEYEVSPVKNTLRNDDDIQIGPKLKSLVAIATLMESASNPILTNFFSKHLCEKSTGDQKPMDFKLPKTDLFHRLGARKINPSKWWQQRPRNPETSAPPPGNHVVRDLYETQKSQRVEAERPTVNVHQPSVGVFREEDVQRIIEDKIQNISESGRLNDSFSDASRSSMRSLFDCITLNNRPVNNMNEESSFSVKLTEAENKCHDYDSMDGIDNLYL